MSSWLQPPYTFINQVEIILIVTLFKYYVILTPFKFCFILSSLRK